MINTLAQTPNYRLWKIATGLAVFTILYNVGEGLVEMV